MAPRSTSATPTATPSSSRGHRAESVPPPGSYRDPRHPDVQTAGVDAVTGNPDWPDSHECLTAVTARDGAGGVACPGCCTGTNTLEEEHDMLARGIALAVGCTLAFGCAEPRDETHEIIDNLVLSGFPTDDIMVANGT